MKDKNIMSILPQGLKNHNIFLRLYNKRVMETQFWFHAFFDTPWSWFKLRAMVQLDTWSGHS